MSTHDDPPRLLADPSRSMGALHDALVAARSELPAPERLAVLQGKLAAATAAAGAAGTGAAATTSISVAKGALWLKIAVVVAGVSAIAGTAIVAISPKREAPAAASSSLPSASTPTSAVPIASVAFEDASAPSADPQPVATLASVSPIASSAPPISTRTSADLTEETRLLTEAQRALASNPTEALRICEAHRKTFARGVLAQERDAVVVEALVKQGRLGEAKRAAAAFARSYPGSSHLRRISDLVGAQPSEAP